MTLAYVFPGQGAQRVGMGRALADTFPAAAAVWAETDAALGWSLSRLAWEGPAAALRRTENAQPALLVASIAALRALEAAPGPFGTDRLVPDVVAGHSLGEYAALVCAGALDLADAVRLVRLRGEAMQAAVPEGEGAMVAILGLGAEDVEALCREAGAEVACRNAPDQLVVAGRTVAVRRVADEAVKRRAGARELDVSAPFHCSLLAPAARSLAAALAQVPLREARVPVVANVDAAPHRDGFADLLVRQVTATVRWEETVARMRALGVTELIEPGADVLSRVAGGLRATPVGEVADVEAVHRRLGGDLEPFTERWRVGGWRRRADGVREDARGDERIVAAGAWRFGDAGGHGVG